MTSTLRRRALIAGSGLLALAGAGGAAAMPTCEGTYAAELLRPLPAPIVAGLDIHDPSPEHLRLAERFLSGLRDAGVTVGPRPNVLLSISSSRIAMAPAQSGGSSEQTSPEMFDLRGGFQLGLPKISDALRGTSGAPPPPMLFFRVEASEAGAARVSWVANLRCRMIGANDGARAEELGRVIGGALGKRIDRGPF